MWFKSKTEWFGFVLFIMLAVVPLVAGLGFALLYSLGLTGLLSDGFTPEIWQQIINDSEIWFSFLYTAYIALCSIGVSLLGSLSLVIFFHEYLNHSRIAFFFFLPLSIPAIVMAFYIFQVLGGSGLMARIFYQLGIIDSLTQFPSLINDLGGTGIITAHVLMATPFFTIFFHNIYRSEQVEQMIQLASTLGADKGYIQRTVVVPMLLRRGFSTIMLYIIFVLGSYEIPLLLGREYPQMLSVLITNKLRKFNLMDIPEAYGVAVLYAAIVLTIVVVTFKKRKPVYDL